MRRFLITQYGRKEVEHAREFIVELPDGVDPNRLDERELERLADDARIGWLEQKGVPVLMWPTSVPSEGAQVADERAGDDSRSLSIGTPVIGDATDERPVTDGFVILDSAVKSERQEESREDDDEPAPALSDTFLSFRGRKMRRTYLLEPVYLGGKPTGEWRVWRRPATNRNIEVEISWEAVLPTEGEAIAWAERNTQGW